MADPRRTGTDVYQQVVDVVGDPKLCRHVDSGTRSLVRDLLRSAGAPGDAANEAGRLAATEVRQLCTSMTPEGRTVIVLVGAVATVVYGVLNYEDLEGDIQQALRRAKVPLSVPLDRVRLPGQLKLGVSLEEFEADYRLDAGPGRLQLQLQNDFATGDSRVNLGYSRPLTGGSLSAGITHSTGNGNTAAFFRFEMRF